MKVFQNGFLYAVILFLIAVSQGVVADSLWTPGFEGYLTAKTAVQAGDIVLVQINSTSSLSFEASANDSKTITLEFSGGEFGNLFSFLPATRTGGSQSAKGKQEYELQTEIAGRITEIDIDGNALIEGSRTFSLENKRELVSISGWIDPETLGPDRRVSFSQLADSRLSFRTFLEPATATLSPADIEEVIEVIQAPAAAPPAVAGAQGPAQPETEAVPAAATQERRSYQLTQEKKVELFLSYINRLVDLLFQ